MTLNVFLPPLPAATNKYIIFFNTSHPISHLIPPNGASEGLTCGEATTWPAATQAFQHKNLRREWQMFILNDFNAATQWKWVKNLRRCKNLVANTLKIKISKAIHNFEDFLHYLQTMSGPLFFTLERQYIVLFCADAYSTMRLIMQLRKWIVYLM